MTRDITSGFTTELISSSIQPIIFVEVYFYSEASAAVNDELPVNLWSGIGDLSWDSKTWVGVGDLLKITPSSETEEIIPSSIQIQLGGVKDSYISLALQSVRQGKDARVWLGFLDSNGSIVLDPYLLFRGRVDTVETIEGPDSVPITISAENRLVDLTRKRERRYTPEDQKIDFPNDKGLEPVHAAAIWSGNWGSK